MAANWKFALIDWTATVAEYGYLSQSELCNESKVIVTCNECKEPKVYTSIVSMRVRTDQKKKGQTEYVPICPSCQQKRTWATNQKFREHQSQIQSAAMQKVWTRDGYRENQQAKHSETSKQLWQGDKYRANVVAGLIQKHATDSDYTERAVAGWRTEEAVASRLAATSTPEHLAKMVAILNRPELLEAASARSKAMWADPDLRRTAAERSKAMWADPEMRQRAAQSRANQPRISGIQHQLYKLLADMNVDFHPEGAETVIGHYVFDCLIPRNGGRAILIECQGDYWHRLPGVEARDRSKFTYVDRYFPEYEVMYLWEHEFYAHGRVLDRIKLKLGLEIPVAKFEFSDLTTREPTKEDVREFLDAYHYIGKGRGGRCFGAYHDNQLVAVAVFSPQLRQNTAGQFGVKPNELVELSRFCIHPSYHKKNFASWFISRCLKRFDCKLVVAYADTTAGHDGSIYKASNFSLHHKVDPDYWYVDQEGFVMHKRTLYGRAVKQGMTERQFAESFGYGKRWGGEKLCFVRWL